MSVELTPGEVELLREMIDSRIGEIHSETRRCRVSQYRDELKENLKSMEQLLEKFSKPSEAHAG